MMVPPKVMKKVHGCLVFLWIAVWITAAVQGWLSSVIFVSHMSMAALVLSSASAYQSSRAERQAEK